MSEHAPRTEARSSRIKELAAGALLGAVGGAVVMGLRATSDRLRYTTVGSDSVPLSDIAPTTSLRNHVQGAINNTREVLHGSPETGHPGLIERSRDLGTTALDAIARSAGQVALYTDTIGTFTRAVRKLNRHARQNKNNAQPTTTATKTLVTVSPLQKYL